MKSRVEILENTQIGIEFEFFTELTDKQAKKSLAKALGVQITIPMSPDKFNDPKPMVHSPVIPTQSVFKLEIDNSGGRKMKELITGPLPYYKFKKILLKMLDWIAENGWTTEKTGIHLNLNFNEKVLGLKRNMQHLNKFKFILDFDEEFIYKRFPTRRDNVYARSIKDITINNIFYNMSKASTVIAQQFKLPMIKYFGMNFLKTNDNYIEVRYLGGLGYEKMYKEIYEVYEHVIFSLYKVLKDPVMSDSNIRELRKIAEPFTKYYRVYKNPLLIPEIIPELLVTVDLVADFQVLKTHWETIRAKLFRLIVDGGVRKGHFNYDTDNGKFEIKNAKIEVSEINGYSLIACEINVLAENCDFEDCLINSSIIHNSNFKSGNEAHHTKIEDCVVSANNKFISSYIDNHNFLFNGEMEKCIMRSGIQGTNIVIDKETEVIKD